MLDRNKSKAMLSNCIAGTSGETNIATMWKDHYSSLLNSSSNITDNDDVCTSFKNMCFNHGMHVSVSEVLDILRCQSNDKATGMDGLSVESLKFADPILPFLLSICFTCMFKHCYLPSSMLDSVIVPLVKNKNGDLFDKNNYNRPIALSSTISKVFENVILYRLEEYLWTTDNSSRILNDYKLERAICERGVITPTPLVTLPHHPFTLPPSTLPFTYTPTPLYPTPSTLTPTPPPYTLTPPPTTLHPNTLTPPLP